MYGNEILSHNNVLDKFCKLCKFYNYNQICTPILEHSEVFTKSLGLSSDIVSKEMYNFVDQGSESLVLRPEGTAALARAIVANSLHQENNKFFYFGPMFRRERPQSGRLRQFHQVGVEYVGKTNYLYDLEVIILAEKFLGEIGIRDKLVLEINTLGNEQSRSSYNKALKEFLINNSTRLSETSKKRLQKNPLRVLDSKESEDQEIIIKSPDIKNYLDPESKNFFESLINGLDKLEIKYKLNRFLVRGLDYYNHTAFEYKTNEIKSQNTVLAGGRYDGLIKSFGGDDLGGVGWAAGVERLVLNSLNLKNKEDRMICIFSTNENLDIEILKILNDIKIKKKIQISLLISGNLKKKFSKANKIGAYGCLIFGEDEWKKNQIIWKEFKTGNQKLIALNEIENFLNKEF